MAKHEFRSWHRYYMIKFMNEQDAVIDQTAKLDNNLFWKMIYTCRKTSSSSAGSEIRFDGVSSITGQWQNYFSDLYSPRNDTEFDTNWKSHVKRTINHINDTCFSGPMFSPACLV